MGQPLARVSHFAVAAEHDDGVPLACAVVRQNFYRVSDDDAYDVALTLPNGDSRRLVGSLQRQLARLCTANAARPVVLAISKPRVEATLCGTKDDYSQLVTTLI